MNQVGIYLDEDVQAEALIEALRARGLKVLTTTEASMSKSTDDAQLKLATSRNLVLASCNVSDFARIHTQWLAAGTEHSEIILIPQQKWGPGELARRIIRLLAGCRAITCGDVFNLSAIGKANPSQCAADNQPFVPAQMSHPGLTDQLHRLHFAIRHKPCLDCPDHRFSGSSRR